ncbi:MAG TPA: SAM-dependent methyltransferase, partial [Pyrinomonadaceae bacterium]|nr:SAM-dependent methyltransferase [Pyrinomonadaceae bacterium]
MTGDIEKFIDAFAQSLSSGTFVKMTLGNYKGSVDQLQKLSLRPVETKKGVRVAFQFRYESREAVKNFEPADSINAAAEQLSSGFRSGHLFTIENDFQLEIGKRSIRLKRVKPTFRQLPTQAHDRSKRHMADPNAAYLKALGVTTDAGEIRSTQQDKWRQINKFIEIISGLIENSTLRTKRALAIADMGSGKGYLTFALYDYLTNVRGLEVAMTGVDTKREMIALCSDIAVSCGFDGLKFVHDSIGGFDPGDVDILIALHACDTATDDALYKGITS